MTNGFRFPPVSFSCVRIVCSVLSASLGQFAKREPHTTRKGAAEVETFFFPPPALLWTIYVDCVYLAV